MVDAPVTYQAESLLGLTRTVQHIRKNQINDVALLMDPLGRAQTIQGDTITVTENKVVRSPVDPTQTVLIPEQREVPIEEYLSENPGVVVEYRIKEGVPYLRGDAVSYNEFAAYLLERYETGIEAGLLDKIGLAVKGHDLLVDDEVSFNEQFMTAFDDRIGRLSSDEQQALSFAFLGDLRLLRGLLGMSFGPYTVPEDGYLMIGDNRNNSSDGRYFGPVKRSEITGKAFAVAFSFKDNKMFAIPPQPAWSRFFKDLD